MSAYTLEFYQDANGRQPVLRWIKDELTPEERRTVGAAMREILQEHGVNVCGTSFGRHLGQGLFEFRLREEGLLVRVFCHAYGNRVILLLGAYDKGSDASKKRQDEEIAIARARLEQWKAS
jgi:phage-related protein